MSDFYNSLIYSAIVLIAGMIAIFTIYNNMDRTLQSHKQDSSRINVSCDKVSIDELEIRLKYDSEYREKIKRLLND